MKKLTAFILITTLCIGAALSFTSCGGKKVSYPEGTETYMFTDDYGREVEVKKNIETIVGSGPNTQIILCTIAADMLVGLNSSPSTEQEPYYPAEFVDMPTLGQFYGVKTSLNIENLIKVNPDIIIDIGDRKEDGKKDMDGIQSQTGIATVYLEATLDNYDEMYTKLGKLLGREEQAAPLAAYCKKTSEYADKAVKSIKDSEKKRIYFGVSTTGLNSNIEGSVQADVIDKIGAKNAITTIDDEINESDGGNPVNLEMVYDADPDIIVFGPDSPYDNANKDSQWSELRAVKDDHYYETPGVPYSWMSSPPSVNQILGIRWLGKIVYPKVFTSDIRKDAKKFYKLFFNYNLSDKELNQMLARSIGKVDKK